MTHGPLAVLSTGQVDCFDEQGLLIACAGTGQDGDVRHGRPMPSPRFHVTGEVVQDRLTGLVWSRNAAVSEFPLMWQEALDFVTRLNVEKRMGYRDWRMPARSELMSLLCYQQTRPPLPAAHPFINLFAGWYWSSTTAVYQPSHAWYLDMDGGRLFYGGKEQSFMLWPVRGESTLLLRRQNACFDSDGARIECGGSGQDGDRYPAPGMPLPRYSSESEVITDLWTGLEWLACADLADGVVNWREAIAWVGRLKSDDQRPWRLPNINELESLVDYDRARPAISPATPMKSLRDAYWSSTTSIYEPDWAWALYLEKGAIGVGQKKGRHFHVMAVR